MCLVYKYDTCSSHESWGVYLVNTTIKVPNCFTLNCEFTTQAKGIDGFPFKAQKKEAIDWKTWCNKED
jgi:hypothetical protein